MFKWFLKNEKLNSKIKISNNSCFVILILAILKFRNIGRFTLCRSKFWPPPGKINREDSLVTREVKGEREGNRSQARGKPGRQFRRGRQGRRSPSEWRVYVHLDDESVRACAFPFGGLTCRSNGVEDFQYRGTLPQQPTILYLSRKASTFSSRNESQKTGKHRNLYNTNIIFFLIIIIIPIINKIYSPTGWFLLLVKNIFHKNDIHDRTNCC